jgi:hypothetical protein
MNTKNPAVTRGQMLSRVSLGAAETLLAGGLGFEPR